MHRPRKRFGQNFLNDRHVLDRVIAAAELRPGEDVLEIGPGLGALTDRLLQAGARVTAIEVDRDLGGELQARAAADLTVVIGDVLRLEWETLLVRPPYKMVANLPYNISSQVLFKILFYRHSFSRLVLMFQKEVGERLLASPATKEYGILSVLMQTWFAIRRVVRVPPGAFYPPPKVDSVVVQLDLLEQPRTRILNESLYQDVVKGAFAQRRKTLRNSLLGFGFNPERVDRALAETGIDPGRRGESLAVEEFGQLANSLAKTAQGGDHA